VGLALGGGGVALLRSLLREMPIGAGIDLAMVGTVAALLSVATLLACLKPTLGVATVNPVVALRQD
jgi:hypothetical protein